MTSKFQSESVTLHLDPEDVAGEAAVIVAASKAYQTIMQMHARFGCVERGVYTLTIARKEP